MAYEVVIQTKLGNETSDYFFMAGISVLRACAANAEHKE